MKGLLKTHIEVPTVALNDLQLADAWRVCDSDGWLSTEADAVGWITGGVSTLSVRYRSVTFNTRGHAAGQLSQDATTCFCIYSCAHRVPFWIMAALSTRAWIRSPKAAFTAALTRPANSLLLR